MPGINGIEAFNEQQKIRENLLLRLLKQFNEGRSKSYYCIAATVLNINELESACPYAKSAGLKWVNPFFSGRGFSYWLLTTHHALTETTIPEGGLLRKRPSCVS